MLHSPSERKMRICLDGEKIYEKPRRTEGVGMRFGAEKKGNLNKNNTK